MCSLRCRIGWMGVRRGGRRGVGMAMWESIDGGAAEDIGT